MTRYRWLALGDVNAFFGLMLDNVVNLVILAGILVYVFEFPAHLVYSRMFPGTALGVLAGDLAYTWMALRLSRRTGRPAIRSSRRVRRINRYPPAGLRGGIVCSPCRKTAGSACPASSRDASASRSRATFPR